MTHTSNTKTARKSAKPAARKVAVGKPVRDDFVDYLVDALAELGPVEHKRFFSGTGFSLDSVIFAFVIRGTLYMRVNEEGREAFTAAGSGPFSYRTSKREVAVSAYYAVPAGMLENTEELCDWARRAFRIAETDREIKLARAARSAQKKAAAPKATGKAATKKAAMDKPATKPARKKAPPRS